MRLPLTICGCLAAGLMSITVAGCGTRVGLCGVPVREPLDPNHLLHVTNPAVAHYLTDPPTSGAHLGTPPPDGVVTTPILPAIQVAILERGDVLVQYRDTSDAAVANPLVREHVVVAPQPTLPARVVVTAWTYKLTCSAIDAKAIAKFADAHIGVPLQH